jgi:hypothetical protein
MSVLEVIGYCAVWWVWQDTLNGKGVVWDLVHLCRPAGGREGGA